MIYILLALSIIPVAYTLLPLLNVKHWVVRGFDYPKLQFCMCNIVLIIGWIFYIVLSDTHQYNEFGYAIIGFLVISLLYLFSDIYPYLPIASKITETSHLDVDTRNDNTVSLLIANVLTPNNNHNGLLSLISDNAPDIILTLESDKAWQEALQVLETDYSYTVYKPLDNLYGMHLYSKLALTNTEIRCIIEDNIPSIHSTVTLKNNQKLDLHCIHPAPPSPTENTCSAERDAELLVVAKEVVDKKNTAIVTGDLNDVAWSKTTKLFKKISGLQDPRLGRGFFNTYNAKHTFLRWPLDHLFHTPDFKCVDIKRLSYFGSDHFPIFITLEHIKNSDKKMKTHNSQKEKEDIQESIDSV